MFYDYFRLQGTDPIDIHLPYVFQHHQSLLLLLGWDNIESHLKQGIQKNGQKGSFCLITVPELENLPTQAKEILTKRGQREIVPKTVRNQLGGYRYIHLCKVFFNYFFIGYIIG